MIRELHIDEQRLLRDFLYDAIFLPDREDVFAENDGEYIMRINLT